MNIIFENKHLEKCANDEKYCKRFLGEKRAKIFKKRLDALFSANNLEELRYTPGNLHKLSSNREGQWAFDLDQPYRLIIEPQNIENYIENKDNFKWDYIINIVILEIIDYH